MALVDYNPRMSANRAASKARESLSNFGAGFSSGQKAVTIVAVIALVAAVVVFADMAGKQSYTPLFSNLSPADASSMTTDLTAAHVPYQLASGGTTVLVPPADVDKERLAMAAAGLPATGSGAGLSLLNKDGITTSSFTQDANYQQAVQDEISSAIDSISGVAGSQVDIVMPSDSAFALGNNQSPSASVLVDLQPGASLTSGQVQAIMHLTASAVPDLTPAGVTVVGSNGDLLSASTTGAQATMSATSAYDTSLESSLTSMLDQVMGPGKAVVQVAATLSGATTSTVSNVLQTNAKGNPVSTPSSAAVTKTLYSGNGAVPGGVLGTNTINAATGKSNYSKTSTNDSFATGEVTKTVDQPPGTVTHLAVSVIVDGLPKGTSLASLRTAIAAAAGVQPARGDTLAVTAIPFSGTLAAQAAAAAKTTASEQATARLESMVKVAAVVVAILVALAIIWRRSRRRGPAPMILLPAEPATPEMPTPQAPMPAITAEQPVANAVSANPHEAARVLRSWLAEVGTQS